VAYLSIRTSVQFSAIVLAFITLTGCPNSLFNSSSSALTGLALSGRVSDGYVQYATVTLDINDDRTCSDTEPTTTTDATGNFTFVASQNLYGGQHMTCATGGIDLSTGLPLVGQLLAPPGATQITPLTSLVMAQINSSLPGSTILTSADIAASMSTIQTSLGLTGIDLLNTDPMAGTSPPALLQATVAVQVLTTQIAGVAWSISGAPTSQGNAIYQNAMNSVAAELALVVTPVNLSATLAGIANSAISSTVTSTQTTLNNAAAANPTDTALSTASTQTNSFAPASVAAFSATAVATIVSSVATATNLATATGAANPATAAQSNISVAGAATLLSPLLTNTVATANTGTAAATLLNNLTTLGNIVSTTLATTIAATVTADAATINAAIVTAVTGITVTAPPVVTAASVLAATTLQNVMPLISIAASGQTATLNAGGVLQVSTPGTAGITNAILNLGLAAPTTLTLPTKIDVGFRVTADVRKFKVAIKGLTIIPDLANPGAFTLSTSGATLNAFGLKAAGNTVNATVSQATIAATIISSSNASGSVITLDVANLLAVLGAADSGFNTLTSKRGTYIVTAVVSNIPLSIRPTVRASNDLIVVDNTADTVSGSSQTIIVTVN